MSNTHSQTSNKTCDFVTIYEILIHLGMYHTKEYSLGDPAPMNDLIIGKQRCKPTRKVSYKHTFGAFDQGQMLDV